MISKAKWQRYIKKLADIDEHAGDLMRQYIEANGLQDNNALIDYAFGLATKYGEASAELGCEMVELMAAAQGVEIPPAVPAETATVQEVAKGVMYGKYHSPSQIPNIVSRQVRQAGADTVMKNAIMNNAEWAWVPSGDTCAFCITLASRGWQTASKKVLKGNHVEHIHSNCDCTFALAFNEKGKRKYDSVYDPKKYEDMYYGAEGRTPGDRINAMRRTKYQQKKDYINAQKRDAYQAKIVKPRETGSRNDVTIFSQSNELYRRKKNTGEFSGLQEPMELKHVKKIAKEIELNTKGYKYKIERDPDLIGRDLYGHTSDDGKVITLFPDAFKNREELVKTLGHEHIHYEQVKKHGKVKTPEELLIREDEARGSEEGWWATYVKRTGYRSES